MKMKLRFCYGRPQPVRGGGEENEMPEGHFVLSGRRRSLLYYLLYKNLQFWHASRATFLAERPLFIFSRNFLEIFYIEKD